MSSEQDLKSDDLTSKPEWTDLQAHYEEMRDVQIKDLFAHDANRFADFHVSIDGVLFDYSKHLVTKDTLTRLVALAKACDLEGWREKMLHGQPINTSEGRAVLHCALRGSAAKSLMIEGENVSHFVRDALQQMSVLCEDIHNSGDNDGVHEGVKVTDIVNIGIGGSDLGPHFLCDALQDFKHPDAPNLHFISNVDGHDLDRLLKRLNPDTTRFIVASKTFTTQETMRNAKTARDWIIAAHGDAFVSAQFYAITEAVQDAIDFGIKPAHILPMRNWVGGRFSAWGTIGFPVMVMLGLETFQALLSGAQAMDTHFKTAPLAQNIPVLIGLIGVWYRNFYGYSALCTAPYSQDLQLLPAYLQQLEMESNGKSIDRDGKRTGYDTNPVIFGEPGTNCQHAFFQLLHQGTKIFPTDFIGFTTPSHDLDAHHDVLLANMIAQSEALMRGAEVKSDTNPHAIFDGNRPSTTLLLDRLDPYHLGMLMALYEHKVFVQGVIWNINSFDQWGVELGKKLAKPVAKQLKAQGPSQGLGDEPPPFKSASTSTLGLMQHILSQSS